MDRSELRNCSDRELIFEVLDQVARLEGKLETHTQLIDQRCKQNCLKVDKHDKTLYGNGAAGLTTRVSMLWWAFGIGSTVLVAAIGGVIVQILHSP